jgi:hypothetical protein
MVERVIGIFERGERASEKMICPFNMLIACFHNIEEFAKGPPLIFAEGLFQCDTETMFPYIPMLMTQ